MKCNSNNRTYNKKSNKKKQQKNTLKFTQALSVIFGQRAAHGSSSFPKFFTFGRRDCLLDLNPSAGSRPCDISPQAAKALSISKLNTTTCSLPDQNYPPKSSRGDIKLEMVNGGLKTLMTGPFKMCSMSQHHIR